MIKYNFNFHIFLSFLFLFLSSLFFFSSFFLMFLNKIFVVEWGFLQLVSISFSLPFFFDFLNLMLASVVLFISGNVMMFSNMYMSSEMFLNRFLIVVVMFILSMMFLLFIPHMISLLLGWDGLGLISYILVIYYQNAKSLSAGMITALMNRIGDGLLIISISYLFCQGHWYIFNLWGSFKSDMNIDLMLVVSLMFAAMTKSAQIPFSSWLPAAMAAPTPVSALVHSSTLVTAGVYLLIRLHPFLSSFSFYLNMVLVISCLTLVMAGVSALSEFDMKKVVALSTLSQLGVMMFSIGLDFPLLAFFHLITHALFKALLFICVGVLINSHSHCQDLRMMGNLVNQVPATMACLNIANFALCGLPFLSGFYSKDLIMEVFWYNSFCFFLLVGFMLGMMFTTMYSFRLSFIMSVNIAMGLKCQLIEDSMKDSMSASILMSHMVIFCGSILNWVMMSPLKDPFLSYDMKSVPTFLILSGLILMNLWSLTENSFKNFFSFLFLNMSFFMWFLVPMSSQMTMNFSLHLSKMSLKVDQGWLETLGPTGIYYYLSTSMIYKHSFMSSMLFFHMCLMMIFISVYTIM